jgi:hypothetical protein
VRRIRPEALLVKVVTGSASATETNATLTSVVTHTLRIGFKSEIERLNRDASMTSETPLRPDIRASKAFAQ